MAQTVTVKNEAANRASALASAYAILDDYTREGQEISALDAVYLAHFILTGEDASRTESA